MPNFPEVSTLVKADDSQSVAYFLLYNLQNSKSKDSENLIDYCQKLDAFIKPNGQGKYKK